MARLMELRVVTPAAVVFQGPVRALVAPAWDGLAGVLPGHAPYLTALGDGPLEVDPESGGRRTFQLSGGVMKVEANRVDVLADRVVTPPKEVKLEATIKGSSPFLVGSRSCA